MIEQLGSETCLACGGSLTDAELEKHGLCSVCANTGADPVIQRDPAQPVFQQLEPSEPPPAETQIDPDRPPWGPLTGISVWLVSVAAIVVVPILAVALWLVIQAARGAPLPDFKVREQVEQWILSPNILLLQIVSTIAAHAITIAVCWAVVTRLRSRPFWASLGWHWGRHRVWYWVAVTGCILVGIQILTKILMRFLPEAESPFDQLLRSSQQVRIAVAALAIFTAPLAEEVVYRGVLFSSLRKYLGPVATIVIVSFTFTGVHVFQNRGAWVSISGLLFLSFSLTIVRARTRSILPCVFIHTLNNAIASIGILLSKGS